MTASILILDDEQEIADLVELYLQNEDFTIHKYYSPEAALECIKTQKIDLAILDVMLPGTDGFAICQEIRTCHNFPVIMLTARVEDMDKITGLTIASKIVDLHHGSISAHSTSEYTEFAVSLPR